MTDEPTDGGAAEREARAREHARRAKLAAVSIIGSGGAGMIERERTALSAWANPGSWPRTTRTRVFFAEAVRRLGQSRHGDSWPGADAAARRPVAGVLIDACADGDLVAFGIEKDNGSERVIPASRWRAADAERIAEAAEFAAEGAWVFVDAEGLARLIGASAESSPPVTAKRPLRSPTPLDASAFVSWANGLFDSQGRAPTRAESEAYRANVGLSRAWVREQLKAYAPERRLRPGQRSLRSPS